MQTTVDGNAALLNLANWTNVIHNFSPGPKAEDSLGAGSQWTGAGKTTCSRRRHGIESCLNFRKGARHDSAGNELGTGL